MTRQEMVRDANLSQVKYNCCLSNIKVLNIDCFRMVGADSVDDGRDLLNVII